MNHKENYSRLLNNLSTIGTKGNDTLTMADCMRFLGQCIRECEKEEEIKAKAKTKAKDKTKTATE